MNGRLLLIAVLLVCTVVPFVSAQDYQPAGEEWITKWYGMDLVLNTGGHNVSATHDWLDEGTGGKLTDAMASTAEGLQILEKLEKVELPDNGGDLFWDVVTIDPTNSRNMSISHGEADLSNFDWYGIIVITSPNERTTTMHPAHDDYGHIWLNGDKVYDNSQWTGGVQTVTTPTEVTLLKGENILLFRCGESGGDDYINLHFEATDQDLKIVPTMDDEFWKYVRSLPVEPAGHLPVLWADLKGR